MSRKHCIRESDEKMWYVRKKAPNHRKVNMVHAINYESYNSYKHVQCIYVHTDSQSYTMYIQSRVVLTYVLRNNMFYTLFFRE